MFERRSRYYRLLEQMAPDRHGVMRSGKALRPLPTVSERLRHTIDGNDRLDHLGYKYYRRSRSWWHILDANPAPLSPFAVLGDGTERTMECTVQFSGAVPPWHQLHRVLQQQPGIDALRKLSAFPELTLADAGWLADLNLVFLPTLAEAVRSQTFVNALRTALQAAGLDLTGDIRLSEETATRWLLWDLAAGLPYRLEHDASVPVLSLFALQPVYAWRLAIDYNGSSLSADAIRLLLISLGFVVNDVAAIGRLGKALAIPASAG